jgi:glutathionyl-hydroquinone reductase
MPLNNPIDDLLPEIAATVERWKAQNTPVKLQADIFRRLDKERDVILLKLLGFDASYGGWNLDHCNGRAGESTAGLFLKQVQGEAIKDWLTRTVMPTLTDERRESIMKGMAQHYESLFREGLKKAIADKAKADIAAVMDEIAKCNNIDKYLKVLGLIGADQE